MAEERPGKKSWKASAASELDGSGRAFSCSSSVPLVRTMSVTTRKQVRWGEGGGLRAALRVEPSILCDYVGEGLDHRGVPRCCLSKLVFCLPVAFFWGV